jgi:uncharacterized membrane protein
MTPVGIVAVGLIVLAFVLYRWRVLSRTGQFDARTEWPYWLLGAAAVAVAIILTMAGRLALLVATPFVLIPSGLYLLRRSEAVRFQYGLDLRRAGWSAVATGTLSGIAAVAAVMMRLA